MKKALALALCLALISMAIYPIGFMPVSAEQTTMTEPTAWYRFDDGTNLGMDATGNGNDLTVFGTPNNEIVGKTNSAVKFDGASSLYAIPDETGMDFADKIDTTKGGTGKITIAYWTKMKASDFANMGWRRAVDNGQNAGLGFGGFTMLSLIDSNTTPTVFNPVVGLSSATESYVSHGNWATYNYTEDWHYITWSLDTTTGQSKFYINGTAIFDTGTMWENLDFLLSNPNALFSIGAQTISQSFDNNMRLVDAFTGIIDELSVFDTVLTTEEITYYMSRGYQTAASVSAPTAWYRFDDGANLGMDATGNGNNLTAFGTPTSDVSGKTNGAVKFDGASSLYATPDGTGFDFADKIDTTKGGTGKITIAYWTKMKASDFANMGWRRAVDNGQNAGLGFGGFTMLSLIDSNTTPTVFNPVVGLSSATESYVSHGNWATYNYTEDWHYITWSLDTTTGQSKFYINGTAIFDTGTMWENLDFLLSNPNALFSIGAQTISQSFDNNMRLIDAFTGTIDELSIFDTTLTPDEIIYYMSRGYESTATGYNVYMAPEMGCTADYTLDDGIVSINALANEGFAINTMYYVTDGGDTVQITGNSFDMPNDNVTVYVTAESLVTANIVTSFNELSDFAQYHQGKTILTGSSLMQLWNTSDADLMPIETANLGISGTSLNWQIDNIGIYKQYNPSAIVVYAGSEDMKGDGLRSKTAEDTATLAINYLTSLKSELGVPVYYISILPAREDNRWNVWNKIQSANSIIKSFCDNTEGINYIDVASEIIAEGTETDGKPLETLYIDDGINLSTAGYDIWATVIREALGIQGTIPQNPPVNESLNKEQDALANLLGYYKFEDTNNPGKDSSYNKNDLALYTQVFQDGENWWEKNPSGFVQTDGAEGQGKAASFDGYNFFVYETAEGKADFVDGVKSLTLSYNIKNRLLVLEEAAYANGWMVAVNNGGNYPEQLAGWSFNCAYNNAGTSNNFPMWIENGNTPVYNTINAGTESADEWNRITYVLDSTSKIASCYLNCTLFATKTITGEFTLNNSLFDFSIGAFAVGDTGEYSTYVANAPFIGYIDSVMVFDGALTAKQIADLDNISLDVLSVSSTSTDAVIGDKKITYNNNIHSFAQLLSFMVKPETGSVKFIDINGIEITNTNQEILEGSSLVIYNDRGIIVNSYILKAFTADEQEINDSDNVNTSDNTVNIWILILTLLSAGTVMSLAFMKKQNA